MLKIFRHISICILIWCIPGLVKAQTEAYTRYINKYMNMAVDQMTRYRIPASITMAQALLESAAGTSRLAVKGNNHFGIKCGSSWSGPYMLVNDDAPNEHFRVYQSVKDSYEDHSKFLVVNRRYANLFSLRTNDYKGWAHGLKAAGYATNPNYAASLIRIIEIYDLSKLDQMGSRRGGSSRSSSKKSGLQHEVKMCNRNFYTIAQSGDTFESIAKEMGVSARKLRKYNEVDRHYKLSAGDIVYFEKKQKQADPSYSQVFHRMEEGESLYLLSQRYGMRLKTLYDINFFDKDHVVSVGDLVMIRR